MFTSSGIVVALWILPIALYVLLPLVVLFVWTFVVAPLKAISGNKKLVEKPVIEKESGSFARDIQFNLDLEPAYR